MSSIEEVAAKAFGGKAKDYALVEYSIHDIEEAKKQGALEERKRFVKILMDINYFLEGNPYDEVKVFVNKWLEKLRK